MPPLHAFRVFETVARLGHVGAAASELNVTPAAVSLQIKALQSALAIELFRKQGRQLVLTESGLALQQAVARGISEITEGVHLIARMRHSSPATKKLVVATDTVLGASWLTPKLLTYFANNSHFNLRVVTAKDFNQIDWRKTDLAVLYDTPPWEGFWWRKLHTVHLTPVCCPQLLRGLHAMRKPSDLLHHRLLHEDDGSQWRRWLLEARVPYPGEADFYIEDFSIALQAARDGYGVALSDEIVSARDFEEGRLVQPFTLKVPAAMSYYCICNENTRADPEVSRLIDWLIAEAASIPLTQRVRIV
ncbi:LysR substrate-binding domain-containing protein [Pseudomonas migulae]|uniref:LysR substrate-binding domain-containing protein n=1 Tax=Pseudomonas migulae TaxID=78543 RepID=UPI003723867A